MRLIAVSIFILIYASGFSQKAKEIELIHADKLAVDKNTPKGASKLKGNVQLRHQNALMYCDSAYLFDNNTVKAYGHVRVVENDSLTMKGDSVFYDGETKIAQVRGNVMIDNKTSILKTHFLDFNRETKVGYYYGGGEIDSRQEKLHLVSKRGYYYTASKIFHFKQDVVMNHPDYIIRTDTMHYSSDLEKTWFYGPTNIDFDNRKIYCEYGWFEQLKDKAKFVKKARIASGKQLMVADTIDYDQKNKIGIGFCKVIIIDSTEKIEINGDYAIYHEADSTSMVTKHMIMKQDMSGDTFFLVADTLYSNRDTAGERIMKAYHHARFFKSDMQGQCDSLVYYSKDSVINLYSEPILWSDDNQITADSIRITLKNSEPELLYMDHNAFIIAKDDSMLYSQIRGRNMLGHFYKSKLNKVDVHGNGETIYYPREDDQSLIGMNETKCSNMTIKIDSSKIEKIHFYDRPSALLTPSDKMPTEGKRLDGFHWRIDERPGSLSDLMNGTSSAPPAKIIKPKPTEVTDTLEKKQLQSPGNTIEEQTEIETESEPINPEGKLPAEGLKKSKMKAGNQPQKATEEVKP